MVGFDPSFTFERERQMVDSYLDVSYDLLYFLMKS